ncbi:MAG: two-component sensor histidine kinase [Cytophagaceae bacterium]|nr:two-component sensor histidine kinase [Cytophagaceae bacterium]|tara:strand:- start:776 stop:2053 length:1278 start_codon:yes stop_codon:yes gene_type:complete
MKLLNQSLKYLSFSILLIVALWACIFYIDMLNEIKGSIDEGLENYKRLIIKNAEEDPSLLTKKYFDESFFTIKKLPKREALSRRDIYQDTIIYMQDADDEAPEPEPVRMLTTAFVNNGQFYELKVANSMVEEDDLIAELFLDTIWLYAILIAGIILINNIVLKRLWDPFYKLLAQLKEFKLGRSRSLPHVNTKTREFNDLEIALKELLVQGNETFEQQKAFIGNASHELQTPLAIASNKLELMIENHQLDKSLANDITHVYDIIQRLVRLNKSLLLLSKIDNKEIFDNREILINTIVFNLVEEFRPLVQFKNIKLEIKEKSNLNVVMDAALANIVISNLLKNAIIHNTEEGLIKVRLKKRTLSIYNTATHGPLANETIFNRFEKSNKEGGGSGLGLAIVKAITNLYDFRIRYLYVDGMHCFKIHF